MIPEKKSGIWSLIKESLHLRVQGFFLFGRGLLACQIFQNVVVVVHVHHALGKGDLVLDTGLDAGDIVFVHLNTLSGGELAVKVGALFGDPV